MDLSRPATVFWWLFATQVLCAKIIFWAGLPVYRKLLDKKRDEASPAELGCVVLAVVLMQTAYWLARRPWPRVQFRRHVFLGHLVLCVGELSFLFPATVATVAVFDESIEWKLDWWRLLILAAGMFAMFCYKLQLQTLGETLMKPEEKGQPADPAAPDGPSH